MGRWSQKMNMGKQWSRGDLMSRSDYTVLRTKRLLASWLNKSSQNLSLFSYIYNAFELLARLLEEWSSVTRLWVEKIWSSVSGYISILKSLSILENTGRAGTGLWRWKDLSRLGYCQSNCVNCWHCKCTIMCLFQDVEVRSKVRTNTVHHIWNINHCTVKISRSN